MKEKSDFFVNLVFLRRLGAPWAGITNIWFSSGIINQSTTNRYVHVTWREKVREGEWEGGRMGGRVEREDVTKSCSSAAALMKEHIICF